MIVYHTTVTCQKTHCRVLLTMAAKSAPMSMSKSPSMTSSVSAASSAKLRRLLICRPQRCQTDVRMPAGQPAASIRHHGSCHVQCLTCQGQSAYTSVLCKGRWHSHGTTAHREQLGGGGVHEPLRHHQHVHLAGANALQPAQNVKQKGESLPIDDERVRARDAGLARGCRCCGNRRSG